MSLSGILGYLSRLPGRSEPPEVLGRGVGWIPVAGLVTGVLAGIAGMFLFTVLPVFVAAFLFVVYYYLLKGILHLDGLADVADGLAAHGPPSARRRAMHDPRVGTAAAFAVALVPIGIMAAFLHPVDQLAFSLGTPLPSWLGGRAVRWDVFLVVLIAELNANSAMVFSLAGARPAPGSRYAAPFVRHATPAIVLGTAVFAFGITFLLGGLLVLSVLVAVIVAGLLSSIGDRFFGGVGGDVLGAVQQITFVAVLLLAAALPWAPVL